MWVGIALWHSLILIFLNFEFYASVTMWSDGRSGGWLMFGNTLYTVTLLSQLGNYNFPFSHFSVGGDHRVSEGVAGVQFVDLDHRGCLPGLHRALARFPCHLLIGIFALIFHFFLISRKIRFGPISCSVPICMECSRS